MKFLLEFVCCGRPATISEDSSNGEAERSGEVETRMQRIRRKKRGRVGLTAAGQGNSAVAPWKPSLFAISEDRSVFEESEKVLLENKAEKAAVTAPTVRRKSGERPRSKVNMRSRSHRSDDYGRNFVQPMIPAFTPAPFMF